MTTPPIILTHHFAICNPQGTEVATADVQRLHGVLFVQNVWVEEPRGEGWGTALMRQVLAHFGHEDLYLFAQSYAGSAWDNATLAAWYTQFGFVAHDDYPGGMRRVAQEAPL